MYKVEFVTNIDAYQRKYWPKELPFRPQIGDLIEWDDYDGHDPLPPLTIKSITYKLNKMGQFDYFECNLWFREGIHPDLAKDILNHKYGG